ncbi:XRE family transcriptional regulator [Microbacterium sp. LRZ72]|uniref:helix-turn-helix domain-containing protein n=1 Tax=Microbacterium sp. LRZ72 TaxID=2942481 RepID=UPI0029A269E9|nr:XRE family transcriptional regulator [Microbacterium sp. LRZ72]MDX2376565.1 XRE family transcriptional regulator [Microbacterium sp. LRZ72]
MAAIPGDESDARMTAELGRRISALRKDKGLTLVALAARTDLSQPFLSQIERGRARPSMPSLHRLASALGTTTPALLSGGVRGNGSAAEVDSATVSLVRVDQGSMAAQSNGQVKSLVVGERSMYPLEFVTSVTEFEDYYEHPGAEFIYVISGHLEVDLADDGIHLIGAGDTLYFAGGVRHRWRIVGVWPARLLVTQLGTDDASQNIASEHM